jgi:CheY-like chemotaxis protein
MTSGRNNGPRASFPLAMPDDAPEKTALVVEDEMLFRLEIRDLLEAEGYAVTEAGSAAQALARLDDAMSLMVTDIRMPGAMDGLGLVREVARRRPDLAVVVVSAQVTPRPEELPMGTPFVGRPFLESSVRAAIRQALSGRLRRPET